jgi:hypothetical protein
MLTSIHSHGPQIDVAVRQGEQEAVLLQPQQHRVVDDPAVRRGDEHVLALAHLALVQVPGDQHVGEPEGVRSGDLDLSLHADVPHGDLVDQVPVLGHRIAVVPGMVEVVVDAVPLDAVLPRAVEVR